MIPLENSTAPRTATALAAALSDARARTLAIYAHLTPEQLEFPQIAVVNPAWWELGHIGWFQEFWCRRYAPNDIAGGRIPPVLAHADQFFDSGKVAHDRRWSFALDPREIRAYLAATLAQTLDGLTRTREDDSHYFHELALYHEDMHDEALLMTLQTLGRPVPSGVLGPTPTSTPSPGTTVDDVDFPGGAFMQGSRPDAQRERFVWDNEKWAHEVQVAPFKLASRCVSNGEFARFVAAGGYTRRELWTDAGWRWRMAQVRSQPAYWRATQDGWQQRNFDTWHDLNENAPVVHVNAHEAEAYCHWAKRRLPLEAEWEYAATQRAPHLPGAVWEWTASAFVPYPGFVVDAYAEYSAPWFDDHRVVRGGSFATRQRLVHARFRNFYKPDRQDLFVGFRTCALQG